MSRPRWYEGQRVVMVAPHRPELHVRYPEVGETGEVTGLETPRPGRPWAQCLLRVRWDSGLRQPVWTHEVEPVLGRRRAP